MSLEETLQNFFNKIDSDNDGSISIEELMTLFKKFDDDNSGNLDAGEFVNGMVSELGVPEDVAKKTFAALDSDGDEKIDMPEMEEFFKKMDGDGDGDVSKDEFITFWKSKLQ